MTSVIGISTPCRRASSSTDCEDFTPSAVCVVLARTSVQRQAAARAARRTARLRDSGELQEATRSPRPASPAKVCWSAPSAVAQAADLGQPAGDQHGPGVVAQAHADGDADGQRDHVLDRAAELAADDVGVGVRAEVAGVAGLLQLARRRRRRCRPRPWRRAAGPAISRARLGPDTTAIRSGPGAGHLGDDLAHPVAGAQLDALHQADQQRAGGSRPGPAARLARSVWAGTASTTRSAPARACRRVAGRGQRRGQRDAGQVVGVLVPAVDGRRRAPGGGTTARPGSPRRRAPGRRSSPRSRRPARPPSRRVGSAGCRPTRRASAPSRRCPAGSVAQVLAELPAGHGRVVRLGRRDLAAQLRRAGRPRRS